MRDPGTMNASTCAALAEDVEWDDPSLLASLVVLGFIDIMVIVGNCLVIAAVFMSSKLRTVTNLFIVSLAVADLMVGVAVLPFSATWEVFKVWIFGDVWCSIWLAVDVWMCTASILNLCAISLDRYVAVTRPVTYPSIMSSTRAKLLIAGVWVLSFVICFPPLVGWKDAKVLEDNDASGNVRIRGPMEVTHTFNGTNVVLYPSVVTSSRPQLTYVNHVSPTKPPPCPWICELTNDAGYVVYSALGSFYIPMLVMLFFYWRIYRAAVQTTRAINQGFRTTKSTRALGNRFDEQRLTLRIHRGRGSVMQHGQGSTTSNSTVATNDNSTTTSSTCGSPSTTSATGKSPECPRLNRSSTRRTHEKIKISVSYPSSDAICPSNNNGVPTSPSPNSSKKSSFSSSPPSSVALYAVHYSSPSNGGRDATSSAVYRSRDPNCHLRVTGSRLAGSYGRRVARRSSSTDSTLPGNQLEDSLSVTVPKDLSPSPTLDDVNSGNKPKLISKMGKRNIKAQVKRFRMETKAAKTLGIIVGGFIVCWLPFFTMYLIRAFCVSCIHPLVFSILFWLGYCNSAINPCIYALFSKDFRFAFKRIICRCFCSKSRRAHSDRNRRRGSDGSQLGCRVGLGSEKGRSPSCNNSQQFQQTFSPNSAGDDSDPNNEGSDSR